MNAPVAALPKVSDAAFKAAAAEMERWGIRPSYLTAALGDALRAAFAAQARFEETCTYVDMIQDWTPRQITMHHLFGVTPDGREGWRCGCGHVETDDMDNCTECGQERDA